MSAIRPVGSPMARRLCLLSILAILVLQCAWPGRLWPEADTAGVAAATVMAIPLLALALGLWRGWSHARFWSGVAALFYFCHGIAEAWASDATWIYGIAEALLSVAVVLASSWDGLRARLRAKPRPTV